MRYSSFCIPALVIAAATLCDSSSAQTSCPTFWTNHFRSLSITTPVAGRMMVGGESRLVVGRATPPEFGPPNDTSFGYLDECEFVPFENAPTMKLSRAMTIANENGTDVMYVLGDYPNTGSANTVLRFDGQTWSQMPSLITGNANAICSATVAGQQRLVAAGNFQFATFSQPPNLNGVAYFNGSAWQPLGEGHAGEAFACIPFDGPFGPTVLIGGDITSASGFAFGNIGFWNGFGWQPLGNGVSGIVHALAEFDDGQGPQVYVGGSFTVETPTGTATNLARWNGTDFEPLPVPNGTVRALDVANDGTTTSLYISGTFTMIDGNEMPGLVRFQNNALESVGGGVWQHQSNGQYNGTTVRVVSGSQNSTSGISVFAEKFYVDDQFTKGYATFDGAGWDSCYSGVSGGAHNVVQIGDDLWIASRFEDPPIRDTCEELAILTPNGWVDPGLSLDNRVDAIYEYPADSGTVYVGGRFQSFSTPSYLIKHENDQWSGLGDEPDGSVLAITSGSVGGFDRLYIGGAFTHVGGLSALRIAQWNGLFWDTLGPGLNSGVTSMVIWDDGTGEKLYVGGGFTSAGGTSLGDVARWDGSQWESVGSTVNTSGGARALVPFTAFGVNGLAAAGNFTTIGGLPTGPAAWWDGQTWTGLGISSGIIDSLAVFDNGTSTSLYLAGSNITTQTLPSDVSLLQWVDGNLDVGPTLADNSTAWGVFNVELSSQPRLLVTGNIKAVTNPGSQPFAVYKAAAYGPDCSLQTCYADCDNDSDLDIFDYICFGNAYAANEPYADCDGDGDFDIFDYICFGNAYANGCP